MLSKMKRGAIVVVAAAALSIPLATTASAEPPPAREPDARARMGTHDLFAPARNVLRRWMRSPSAKVARDWTRDEIRDAGFEYLVSGGTSCRFPLPQAFCISRRKGSGLGQAVSHDGRRPGVWKEPSVRSYRINGGLIPGLVYKLTCWQIGDTINGPFGRTSLWYRLPSGGYVSDSWVYTGTNNVLPNVRHC